ncbi:MAG TPA: 4-alpha-glucanotransferase [Thermoanaerobaculia bacterium]|nr:4-alpha-glucanotransferase [Thermoanaerobaculia bacterium]
MSDPELSTGRRVAGILLHPTSLPGEYGVGDLGDELIAFLDWASSAGIGLWQVLPLNPPGYGQSPYDCLSSEAGNPLLISPQRLLQDGLITPEEVGDIPPFDAGHVQFDAVRVWKGRLLRAAWECFRQGAWPAMRRALSHFEAEEREWLDDFALYMAIKESQSSVPWWEWSGGLAHRDPAALKKARRELNGETRFQKFMQFLFFRQWQIVREAARDRNILIMGDVPIYVAHDSGDVWANRELFHLDESGAPTVVAGVPPDYFSATGQRWGNPLYRWDILRRTGYRWWINRLKTNLELTDLVRLDHFRGFAAYWEIPAHEPTAIHGRWMPGPGKALFNALQHALGSLPLVAEDLGYITPEVHELRQATGLPGMRVLQFGFGQADSPHLPHRFEARSVVYTGTHDNDTALGWFQQASAAERDLAHAYLGEDCNDISWALIRAAYTSVAETAIVPVQDVLGLGSEARMNTPGDPLHNWSWRVGPGMLTRAHAERLRKLAEITGRVS